MADEDAKPPKPFIRSIELADYQLGIANATRPLRVFVAGPYIERGWSFEVRQTKTPAAHRRIDVIEYVEATLQHGTVLGEHRGVAEMGDRRLRSRSSAALTELNLVRETCDAIVMLPSSPGSFCELGTWSIYEDICKKMIIIADRQFEGETGYLNVGVYKTAQDNGAKLAWVDYQDKDLLLEIVEDHIGRMQDRVNARAIVNV